MAWQHSTRSRCSHCHSAMYTVTLQYCELFKTYLSSKEILQM